jgi:hypothetical protein
MKNLIRKILKEDLENWSVTDATKDEYEMGPIEESDFEWTDDIDAAWSGESLKKKLKSDFPAIQIQNGYDVGNNIDPDILFILTRTEYEDFPEEGDVVVQYEYGVIVKMNHDVGDEPFLYGDYYEAYEVDHEGEYVQEAESDYAYDFVGDYEDLVEYLDEMSMNPNGSPYDESGMY